MEYTHHILGFDWRIGEDQLPRPVVSLRDEQTQEIKHLPLDSGYNFNWVLTEQRYCPGWTNFNTGEHSPCKYNNALTNGYDLCPHCESQSGFKATFFYNAEPNEHMQEFLKKPQNVYLAFFQPNTIKVGTAIQNRERIRLIEQDALIGRVIAEAPGHTITKIEREISRALGYTEFVNSKLKYKYMHTKPDTNSARMQLDQAVKRVHQHLEKHLYAEYLLPVPAIREHDHTDNPHVFYPDIESGMERLREINFLAGEFRGLRHKYLLIDHQGNLLVLNKRYLSGRKMRHIPDMLTYPELSQKEKPEQISLFG